MLHLKPSSVVLPQALHPRNLTIENPQPSTKLPKDNALQLWPYPLHPKTQSRNTKPMKHLLSTLSLFLLALVVQAQTVAGDWNGSLNAGGQEITMIFHFSGNDDALTGTLDIPAQGAKWNPRRESYFCRQRTQFIGYGRTNKLHRHGKRR